MGILDPFSRWCSVAEECRAQLGGWAMGRWNWTRSRWQRKINSRLTAEEVSRWDAGWWLLDFGWSKSHSSSCQTKVWTLFTTTRWMQLQHPPACWRKADLYGPSPWRQPTRDGLLAWPWESEDHGASLDWKDYVLVETWITSTTRCCITWFTTSRQPPRHAYTFTYTTITTTSTTTNATVTTSTTTSSRSISTEHLSNTSSKHEHWQQTDQHTCWVTNISAVRTKHHVWSNSSNSKKQETFTNTKQTTSYTSTRTRRDSYANWRNKCIGVRTKTSDTNGGASTSRWRASRTFFTATASHEETSRGNDG